MAPVEEAVPRPEGEPSLTGASGPRSSRAFVVTLALFLLLIEAAAQFYLLPNHVAQIMDFRQLYTAGYMLRTEPAHLYDIQRQVQMQTALTSTPEGILLFNHTPFEAAFFLPFSYLSYGAAYRVMLAINVLLIAVCFFSLQSLFSSVIPLWQPRPGLIFFPFLSVAVAVMHGQDSLLFLAVCCLVLRLLLSQQDFFAGLLLSITLFKPQLTLPLAVLLVARRGRNFLLGFVSGSLVIALACLRLVHLSGLKAFLHVIAFTNAGGQHASILGNDPTGTLPFCMPNLHGLLFFSLLLWLPHVLWLPIMVAVSLGVLLWTARRIRLIASEETAFAYAVVWTILLSYLNHISDLPLWILPLVVLASMARHLKGCTFIISTAFILPALIVFVLGRFVDPNPWLWVLSLPLLATAIYLERASLGGFLNPLTSQDHAVT